MNRKRAQFEYDVCLSFAGEDRKTAEQIARALKREKLTVFYDYDYKLSLWGKDLFKRLFEVYSKKAEFCVILFSPTYLRKNWTNHELRAAQLRTLRERREYVLPVKIARGSIPEEFSTIAHLDLSKDTVRDIALGVSIKKGERAWEKGWVPEADLVSALNHEMVADTLVNALRMAVSSEKNSNRAFAKALCSIIYLCQDDVDGPVAAYFSELLTLFSPLHRHFDNKQEFAMIPGVSMKRWLTEGARCKLLMKSKAVERELRKAMKLKRSKEWSDKDSRLLEAAFKRARRKRRKNA